MSWPSRDLFAVTVDGRVLMNAHAIDDVDLAELVGKQNVFVGITLTKREVRMLSERMHDANSEAAALIAGKRHWGKRRRSP